MRFKESGATGILYANQPVYSLYIRGAQSIMHHIRSNNNQTILTSQIILNRNPAHSPIK